MDRTKVALPCHTKLTLEEEALRIDVFWEALKQFSMAGVAEAFQRALAELKWFPAPADIVSLIEERTAKPPLLEWAAPTEEGRQRARQLLREIVTRMEKEIEDEDRKREERRGAEYQKAHAALKKQAKLFRGGKKNGEFRGGVAGPKAKQSGL